MKTYKSSLRHRRNTSARIMERYHSDPEFRLRCINADRARRGAPLLASLDEAKIGWPKRSWSEKRGEQA